MRIFKLKINDEEPIFIGVDWGGLIIAINVNNIKKETYLSVRGKELGVNFEWVNRKFKVGDRIKLESSDSKIASTPFLIESVNREDMKQRYWELKKELEEKGIFSR